MEWPSGETGVLAIGEESEAGESPAVREPIRLTHAKATARQLQALQTLGIQVEYPELGDAQSVAVVGNAMLRPSGETAGARSKTWPLLSTSSGPVAEPASAVSGNRVRFTDPSV